jgi:L-fuconolactonase
MQRIDAHCHFWNPARGDYSWLMAGPASLDPLRRVFAPTDLAALNAGARVVAVQAADSTAETEYLLQLAAQNPQIVGVVGWVNLASVDAAGDISRLAKNPLLRGVRPMLQDIADSRWILAAPKDDGIRALIAHGLCFDALVQTRHLAPLAEFARRWPDLPIVIDHCAKPVMTGDLAQDYTQGMAALAAQPHVMCKLSGLLTELPAGHDDALSALRPVVDLVLNLFGPNRVMWGSDWPVLTLAASYQDWADMTDDLLAGVSSTDRADIMGQTATKFYRLGRADA